MKLLLLSTGGGGGNILRSVKALFDRDLALTAKADSKDAARLRDAVTTRFLDTNEFSLTDVPPEERLIIGSCTTGRLGEPGTTLTSPGRPWRIHADAEAS